MAVHYSKWHGARLKPKPELRGARLQSDRTGDDFLPARAAAERSVREIGQCLP